MFYSVYSGKTCFPPSIALTGSFSSKGVIITTNTATTLSVGNYLYSTTNNELKKITKIYSTTSFAVESPFTPDVSEDNTAISDSSIIYSRVIINNFGNASGLLNGAEYPKETIIDLIKNTEDFIFVLDGTGTKISITVTK